MSSTYVSLFLESVKEMLDSMSEIDRAKTKAHMKALEEGNFHLVETKILKSPIRELKFKKYRFVFFIHQTHIYFIHAFIKQTAKTPKREINHAEKIYKQIIER